MGSNTSKQERVVTASASSSRTVSDSDSESFNEKHDYSSRPQDYSKLYAKYLRNLTIKDNDNDNDDGDNGDTGDDITDPFAGNPLSIGIINRWEKNLLSKPKDLLAQAAFAKNSIESIIAKSDVKTLLKDQYLFNVSVKTIGSPSFYNNQKSSGRCWIFASSNVFRTHVINNYNLSPDKFQLSQSYLFFYDKLEKANFFLETVLETHEEDLDSRLIQYLLSSPVGDGGQWDMIVNLVNKYGLVPHEFFPDNAQAISSSKLNYILTEKLREFALTLRDLKKQEAPELFIRIAKLVMTNEVFNIISLALGTPPKATDTFTWEFVDKDGNYKSFETNPIDFYKNHVKYDAEQHFSLIHDPRNEFDKLYTVDKLNNIYGGKPIEYVNTEIDEIKRVAIKMLKDDEPIFFGSDVGKFGDRVTGVLDTTAYDYDLGFGIQLGISKAERLRTGSSQMTHAMVITGVHLDPVTGKPIRWKIENSWGDEVGDKGYFVMTDEWFNEYVFQIVTNKKYASKKSTQVWKSKEFVTLPYYDPMGALA
ncbi:aminopeptidase and bleomycin hydrolase [Scheffersomyces amazonensis]|uniref:aminopeptidase and bleomycin hydrolase n=1 Tax=Scheffersomyces amazonensis TaxID=1078765 RepID=UPI00315DA956